MSQWPWWLWVMWVGAIAFVICKLLIIVDKLREVGKSKPATPPLAKKDDEPANPPVVCTASQPEQPKMKSGKDGRWVEVCDACSVAWELDGKELLADGKCLKCSGTVRSVWYPFPPKESVAEHHVGAADYRAGKARDELHCTKCYVTWTGVNAKPYGGYWVSPERAEAFKAMRCPDKDCGGELRNPLPGERFGLYVYPSTHKPSEAMTAQDYAEELEGTLRIWKRMEMRKAGASDEEIRKVFWGRGDQDNEKPTDQNPATA